MNDLEKRSFYSFLTLYIISSFIFILAIGYWYYIAQENALKNETYYKLQHIADIKSGDIIIAHMKNKKMKDFTSPKGIILALIDINGKVVEGELLTRKFPMKNGYFEVKNFYNILVSDTPKEHLNIAYVVVQATTLIKELSLLKIIILKVLILSTIFIVIVAWFLSKLFMKPVRERVEEIERFINDITHELNTPITSLLMITNQGLKDNLYTKKMFKNISISSKQLYDMYSSLTYLNFSNDVQDAKEIDISEILKISIEYYQALCEIKGIEVNLDINPYSFEIPKAQLRLLYGNLIGNAIKYSSKNSIIEISLKDNIFTIKDKGIGIELKRQKEIFKKFKRVTEYGGGFGIGLHIVQNICEEYQIKLSLNSRINEGSEFILKF